ncbi:MAG: Gfo/Idh/MocA family oxidoreductase [Clostridia bacterium]|nr:Gfo/Idh/MocA family oxidoreductase [Clostridia bacterium]
MPSYIGRMENVMKIGIIGLGAFSDDFVRLFNIHPDVEEVVVADLCEEKVQESMRKHGIKRGFTSYEDLLEKAPDVDSIGIFTQRHLHGPMIVKALEMGKHVYSAVPIGCTIDEIREIIKLVEEKRLIYMMGETCYYYPCAIYCREKYKTGEMGKFVYGESQYYHDIYEMYDDFKRSGGDNWRRVAGIPPMFYPTHSISMIFSAIDQYATKVSCMGLRDNHEDNVYGEGKNNWDNPFSNETALFQMSGGGVVRINEFRRVGINKPSSYITCFYGDKGAYECSVTNHTYQRGVASGEEPYLEDVGHLVNTIEYNEDLANGTMDKTKDPISVKYIEGPAKIQNRDRLPEVMRVEKKFSHYNSHPFLVDDFVRAVMTGKLPPNNAWESARYMIPGLIAHESALRGGELLDIPDFGDAPADWERVTYEIPESYSDTSKGYDVDCIK